MGLRELGLSPETFRLGWPREPLTTVASPKIVDVLTARDVDGLIADRGLRLPAFRMVKDGAILPTESYTLTSRRRSHLAAQMADPWAIHRAMSQGATLILQDLQVYHPPTATLVRDVASDLDTPAIATAFLTPKASAGFGEHTDPNHELLVQLSGEKEWRLRARATEEPKTIVMRPLDVLWLPAGWLHDGATTDKHASVHLTIALTPVRLTRIVDQVATALATQLSPEVLPPMLARDPEQVRARVVALLSQLRDVAASVEVDGLVAALIEETKASLRVAPGVSSTLGEWAQGDES